ncbi:hypothetical protein PABG_02508 [Paracoccidioides brasiliensis Pb03]|nr:hypothetical protein PABG_02508 [Paracoccidioides brasiliensis Pb03]
MASNSATSRLRPSASEVPITSRWCNRALRPLTSTILRLEKHWKITPLGAPNLNSANACSLDQDSRTVTREERETSESESTPNDPTWVPGRAMRKRIRHKYSTRTGSRSRVIVRSPEAQKLLPGQFSLPTPLIKGQCRQGQTVDGANGNANTNSTVVDSNEDSSTQNSRRVSTKRKPPPYSGWNSQKTWKDSCEEYNESSYIAIAQGIFQVWDTFLIMTAPQQSISCGARSLMSMALDTTSMYIAQEQEVADNCEDKDEQIDVADLIFTELENIYGTPNAGWKPLKALVRLHGIRLVCEGIQKRWISPMIGRQLVLNSIESSSYDAAREILSALLSVSQRIEGPSHLDCTLFSSRSFGVFHTLATYVNKSSHLSFFFREIGTLLRYGIVPVEWIATESMKPFVTHAIQSISCEDGDCSASALFIVNMILVASGSDTCVDISTFESPQDKAPNTSQALRGIPKPHLTYRNISTNSNGRTDESLTIALNNSISSILGILCSAHIVRFGNQPHASSSTASSMQHVLARLSAIMQHDIQAASLDIAQNRTRSQLLRTGYILMADYLLNCRINRCSGQGETDVAIMSGLLTAFESFTSRLKNRKDLTGSLSTFVTHVSQNCGRARADDGFNQLELFTDALIDASLQRYPTLRALLSKVAVDAALDFAEYTLHPDHHSWAAHIQTKVGSYTHAPFHQGVMVPLTPSLALSKSGYIWEDSIGEWIAAVPGKRVQRGPGRHKNRKGSSTDPRDVPSNLSNSEDARMSRSSSKFSASSEGYNSSITSSDSPYPSCSRRRKRIVNFPEPNSSKRNKAAYTSTLSASTRRLWSRGKRAWNLYIDERGDSEPDPLIPDQITHLETATKFHESEPILYTTRALRERKRNNYPHSPVAVEVKVPLEAPRYRKAVEVVISNTKKKQMEGKPSKFPITKKRVQAPAKSDSGNDVSSDDDDNDNDEDVLAIEPPRLYPLQCYSSNTTNPRISSPVNMITRLRSTRSSSLRNLPIVCAAENNLDGSSDDELSFL